jgi:hydroxymethylpyrimidine pyrophosphatase-like HAD family hydrolase
MTADIRLLVLDIDGTLAGQSNQISDRVLATIRQVQRQGVQVAIATGRMYQSAVRFHQAVGSTLPLMAYQGAFIKNPLTQVLHRHTPLPRPLALELLTYLTPWKPRRNCRFISISTTNCMCGPSSAIPKPTLPDLAFVRWLLVI